MNLHNYIIFITKYWMDKRYYVPPCPKVGGDMYPRPFLKLGLWYEVPIGKKSSPTFSEGLQRSNGERKPLNDLGLS